MNSTVWAIQGVERMGFAEARSSLDAGHPGLSAGSSRDYHESANVDCCVCGVSTVTTLLLTDVVTP
jgi:hypothetical protein